MYIFHSPCYYYIYPSTKFAPSNVTYISYMQIPQCASMGKCIIYATYELAAINEVAKNSVQR